MGERNAAISAASGKEVPQPSYITYITNILLPKSDLFGLSACFRVILKRFAKKDLRTVIVNWSLVLWTGTGLSLQTALTYFNHFMSLNCIERKLKRKFFLSRDHPFCQRKFCLSWFTLKPWVYYMKDILNTNEYIYKYLYYRANSKQIYIILYTWACCGAVCSLTVDVTTGWMLLYQVGRRNNEDCFFNCCCCWTQRHTACGHGVFWDSVHICSI